AEREERLVGVGPLVVANAQTAKLISTRQMCAPRPTANGPGHSHAPYDAWRASERCDESEDRAEWRLRRSRDPRAHSPDAAAVAPIRCAGRGSHPPRRQGFL